MSLKREYNQDSWSLCEGGEAIVTVRETVEDNRVLVEISGALRSDTEHCFQGDADSPTIYFDHSQPTGGYDYKKPEPKKQSGGLLGALFG